MIPSRNDLKRATLDKMCESAVVSLGRQCGREYGFTKPGSELRSTKLDKLSPDELEDLLTTTSTLEVICPNSII